MPRYLVERTLSTCVPGAAANSRDKVIRAHALEGVTWLHSFVTTDRRRSFCIVDSPSPEAIRVAAQATALPVDRITEVRVFDPYILESSGSRPPEIS